MTSIHTNSGAVSALATLRETHDYMQTTQNRVSSGLRVGSASDNAAYWSISTTMKSSEKVLGAVNDALSLSQAIMDVTYTSMDQIRSLMDEVKNKVILGRSLPAVGGNGPWDTAVPFSELQEMYAGSTLEKVDKEIQQLSLQVWSAAKSANFNGVNLLVNAYDEDLTDYPEFKLPTGYGDGSGLIFSELDLSDITLFNANMQNHSGPNSNGLLDAAAFHKVSPSATFGYGGGFPAMNYQFYAGTGQTTPLHGGDGQPILIGLEYNGRTDPDYDRGYAYDTLISSLDAVIEILTDRMATVGALSSSLEAYADFNQSQQDALTSGIGRLIDADMNEESSRLKALQTREQLVIQSLSIANAGSQGLLSLFN